MGSEIKEISQDIFSFSLPEPQALRLTTSFHRPFVSLSAAVRAGCVPTGSAGAWQSKTNAELENRGGGVLRLEVASGSARKKRRSVLRTNNRHEVRYLRWLGRQTRRGLPRLNVAP